MTDVEAKRREERVKLFASAISNVGVAAVVAGLIGPLVAQRFNALVALGSTLFGFGLHLVAQCVLHYVTTEPPDGGGGDER